MASMNKVFLIGRVSTDVDHRVCKTGLSVSAFSLAVNEKGKNGDVVTFINIKCFGKVAEICKQYLGKGSEVLVDGKYRIDTWEDRKSNSKRYTHYIMAETVQFMGGKQNSNERAVETQNSAYNDDGYNNNIQEDTPAAGKYPPASFVPDEDDEDVVPF